MVDKIVSMPACCPASLNSAHQNQATRMSVRSATRFGPRVRPTGHFMKEPAVHVWLYYVNFGRVSASGRLGAQVSKGQHEGNHINKASVWLGPQGGCRRSWCYTSSACSASGGGTASWRSSTPTRYAVAQCHNLTLAGQPSHPVPCAGRARVPNATYCVARCLRRAPGCNRRSF